MAVSPAPGEVGAGPAAATLSQSQLGSPVKRPTAISRMTHRGLFFPLFPYFISFPHQCRPQCPVKEASRGRGERVRAGTPGGPGPRPRQPALQGLGPAGSWHQPDQLPRGPAAPRRARPPSCLSRRRERKKGTRSQAAGASP